MDDPGVRTALETRTARNPGDLLNLRDSLGLRGPLNPSNVLRAACLRMGVPGAVPAGVLRAACLRVGDQGVVRVGDLRLAPALRRRQRLLRVVAIRNRAG
jgi:hypothetical protein